MPLENLIEAQKKRIVDGMKAVRCAAEAEAVRIRERLDQPGQRLRVVGMPPPPPIELFRGRQTELEILADHLSTPGVRIIAIIGKTGMGKTALARKLLQDLEEGQTYEGEVEPLDGIVYLSTRTSGISFERVYFDCAQMLGGEEEDGLIAYWGQRHTAGEKAATLLNWMKNGNYVILLDNLEDQLDSKGRIREEDLRQFFDSLRVREMTDSARLLITSRADLAVPTETQDYHRGLPLNDGLEAEKCLDMLRQFDTEGTLGLRSAPDVLLIDLARAVGGAPRALELIASLLEHGLSLEDVMSLVDGGAPASDKDPVRILAEANYKTLEPNARLILQALSVFGRTVPVVGLDFLLQLKCLGLNVPELVDHLRRTHTITYETLRRNDPDSSIASVSLHPTDDEVAAANMSPDVAASLHLRAAEYYAALRLPKPWFRIRQVEPRLLEFEHRLKGGDYVGAEAVMDAIDYSWINHHKYLAHLMSLGYGEDSIKRRERLAGCLGSPIREVHNRVSLGWVCRRMGKKDKAKAQLEQAVKEARLCGDQTSRIYALSELGYFLTDNASKHDQAKVELAEAREIAKSIGDIYSEAHTALGLAFADFQLRDNPSSLKNAGEALRLFQQVPTPLARYREIDCWVRLGMIYRKTGDYKRAIETAEEGLKVARAHKMPDWEAELCSGLGFHNRALGRFDDAAREHENALNLFKQQRGMKREEAVQYSYLGNVYVDLGRFVEARKAYDEAERIARSIYLRRELSWILGNAGVLYCRLGEPEKALALQEEGGRIVEENHHLDSRVIRCTDLAATHLAMNHHELAEKLIFLALQSAAEDEKFSLCADLPEAYITSPHVEDKLPHEMQSPGDHQRRGALLARIYLIRNRPEAALAVMQAARKSQIENPHQHYLTALHALALMRLHRTEEAEPILRESLNYAHAVLNKANDFYSARYGVGFICAALAILNTGAAREGHVRQSLEAYQQAKNIYGAPGGIKEALDLLGELRKIDNEGILNPLQKALSLG